MGKNAFKLPRASVGKRKIKEMDGLVLKNMHEPVQKKRKKEYYNEIKAKKKMRMGQSERNRMTNAVDDAWPEEEIANLNPTKKSLDDLQRNEMRNAQELEKKKQREDKNRNYKQKGDSFEHDDEYKFPAQDMLDAAPVPVLDQ